VLSFHRCCGVIVVFGIAVVVVFVVAVIVIAAIIAALFVLYTLKMSKVQVVHIS